MATHSKNRIIPLLIGLIFCAWCGVPNPAHATSGSEYTEFFKGVDNIIFYLQADDNTSIKLLPVSYQELVDLTDKILKEQYEKSLNYKIYSPRAIDNEINQKYSGEKSSRYDFRSSLFVYVVLSVQPGKSFNPKIEPNVGAISIYFNRLDGTSGHERAQPGTRPMGAMPFIVSNDKSEFLSDFAQRLQSALALKLKPLVCWNTEKHPITNSSVICNEGNKSRKAAVEWYRDREKR